MGGLENVVKLLEKDGVVNMARNSNAGKHASYDKKGMSDEQIAKKGAYDKKYHATTERKKYRAALNKKNRDKGTYGNGDGKDESHKKDGSTSQESQSKNRARNGRNGKSTKR